VILFLAALLSAPPGTVHGTVVSAESSEPLAFSIVSLRPGLADKFTDGAGAFAFAGIEPGTYRLLVRQIGFTPAETTLVIGPDADVTVRIALARVAVELPPITVTGALTCTQPGPPDAAVTPALAAVFDQLLENARRYRLLADSFPFTFVLERTDHSTAFIDTIAQTSAQERRRYRPGSVIAWGEGPFRGQRVVRLPGLEQFADSAFVHAHCFRLAGRDTAEGEQFVRVDFEPAERLRSADVAGAAYLEEGTYQLRFTRVHLTKPQRALPGVVGLVATTRFRQIVPGIVLHDRVRAVTTLKRRGEQIEEQRLLDVHFVRPFTGH
jgi:Carboxypeptidase regulatory-like domain